MMGNREETTMHASPGEAKILVVEDEGLVALGLKQSLQRARYDVPAVASSGEEAIELARRLRPDLVLMDIQLRGSTDGVSAAEQIWEEMEIPVVYLTAHADETTLARARRTAPFGYLLKPFQDRELELTIEMALYKHRLDCQIRDSEERYRTLFDRVPIGLFRCRPDGTLLMVNPALVNMLGFPDASSLLATNATELYDHADHRLHWAAQARDGCATIECRARMRRYDGRIVWIEASVRRVYSDGELEYLEGSVEDITQRKEDEDAIHQHAAQLEVLNQVMAAAVAAPNLEVLLETALHQVLRVLGVEMGAIWAGESATAQGLPLSVGRSLAQLDSQGARNLPGILAIDDWHEENLVGPLANTAELLAPLGIRCSLAAPIMVDGRAIGGMSLAGDRPRTWSSHEVTFVEAIGRQLGTAAGRLRLLDTIREQVLRLHQIIHTVPEGVVLLDADRHIILANPTGRGHLSALTDAQPGDALAELGGTALDAFLTSPHGQQHEIEWEARIFEIVARVIESTEGHEGWVLLTHDVTDERSLQRRTEQRDRLAAVGQLAAGIAHDFSNIMAVVLLYAQMALREPETPSKTRERLEVIGHQARRATDLIHQILDFSRNTLLERQQIDLIPFLKETVKLLTRTLPSDIIVNFNYGMGEHVVSADPTRIQQLVMNLALNARDAMPQGGNLDIALQRITLQPGGAMPLPELTPGEWVCLSVADTGQGIAPDVLPRIFEPFFTTKPPGQGCGLGLAQVYGIVEQHDGFIGVVTERGRGSTFTVYLPALSLPGKTPEQGSRCEDLMLGHNETIMVVEDGAAARDALAESLAQLDYQVLEASNGEEALRLIREHGHAIELVLTDVVMPQMGGLALLEALNAEEWDGPTIVLSGHPLDEVIKDRLLQNGVVCLEKPVDLAELAAAVSLLLAPRCAPVHAMSLA
jgi:two-component system cell cycle sensor histidine kinase/response regulator CckA